MAREVLSLKSIYKFLTLNDYPVYSEGIIKKDNRTGLTLNKFYLENLLIDFKNRKTGKILWRAEGSRNRYISEICNRSERLSIYKEYAEEVMLAADYDTVIRQIRQYMSFLLERQYNVENFVKKIPAMIEMYEERDDAFTQEASDFFRNAMEARRLLEGQGLMVDTFCCGWILTMFTIHALMGNGEGEEHLHRIRSDKNYSLHEMLKRYQEDCDAVRKQVVFYTENFLENSAPALKQGHFFGREVELFELREMLAQGGKYLISGIGGSGKTELIRQFLKICMEEALVDGIAVFLQEEMKEIETVSMPEGQRNLVILDGMDKGIDEHELKCLCNLPAAILATSCECQIEGFECYHLRPITQDAASLIFRDNYDGYLEEADRQALEDIVSNVFWCHAGILRQLAKYVRENNWSLLKLKEQLEQEQIPTEYSEEEYFEILQRLQHRYA
ncbi:MAG: ATP-binding protein [Agathobacter sp.]|nr:ATP-binding protein [Agathobacter sp.]